MTLIELKMKLIIIFTYKHKSNGYQWVIGFNFIIRDTNINRLQKMDELQCSILKKLFSFNPP